MNQHIAPGYNGWTLDAKRIINAIDKKTCEKQYAAHTAERAETRQRAELEYYEENNCFPRSAGFFGTETDAHFNER